MKVMLWLNDNVIQNNNPNIVSLFAYGSRVYGTNDEYSDRDYICIIKEEIDELTNKSQLNFEDGDITFYTEEFFKELLVNHEISAIECVYEKLLVFNPEKQNELKNYFKDNFNLNKLRESFSRKASNSWVKGKKKIIVEKDYNWRTAIKSIFHSIRILNYGYQLALTGGNLFAFSMVNDIWFRLKEIEEGTDYSELKKEFQPIYNDWHHKFVELAPKEIKK